MNSKCGLSWSVALTLSKYLLASVAVLDINNSDGIFFLLFSVLNLKLNVTVVRPWPLKFVSSGCIEQKH